ncbi:MAG: DNA polymerase III subunit alpha [Alphaproteobacteria bacterium MarineAlpha9_Bin2]|nr:MAG: DNA polymerase III subunit alpha [Alphaproteobacteria bacterium MarineAlpha9_Bin2]
MEINHRFVHLRARSSYSLAQGAILIDTLISLAKRENMPALALTDEGNLFGTLEFALKASEKGIQPIIGCILELEMPDQKENHKFNYKKNISKISLIVRNKKGWKNLSVLVSNSFLDSNTENQRPISLKELFDNSEGLSCLMGGTEGPLGIYLLENKYSEALKISKLFKQYFTQNLFIELMRHGLEDEKKTEHLFIKISSDLDIPIIATNNIYFSDRTYYESHDCLMCISQGTTISDVNRKRLNVEHFFKSQSEMLNLFSDLPEAISNTLLVAKKCLFMLEKRTPTLPNYPLPDNKKNEHQLLIEMSKSSLNNKLKLLFKNNIKYDNKQNNEKLKVYRERLSYELDVIHKTGFSAYFLIVAEFVNWAKKAGIPVGPGRGSGAGSLVAWVLGITDLNPIKYNLLFERFLNPERISMPDFDIDFCPSKRGEVIKHVQDIYGEDKVAQIITFGSLQARGVLRDVGRVLEIPFGKVDNICRMIPANPFNPTKPLKLQEAIDHEPRLKSAQKSDEEIEQLFQVSLKLEGLHKNASTHAAGVVIGDKSLLELLPLYRDPKSDLPATQFDMKYTELSGLVKFDFLGLKTLSIIDMASSMLKKTNPDFNLHQILQDDKRVFNLISAGNTVGIFQLEGVGVTEVLKKIKPDHFEDLMSVVALYRPGPMDNIPSFIRRKHKKEKVDVLHPLLNDIVKETYGIMVYQEQVMEAAQKLAGYSLGEADLLRKAMGKKIDSEMQAQREIFVKGAKKNNIKSNTAIQVFEIMARFAGYGFNKSHAAAYALIAYQTAWFKTYHPEIFLASLMTYDSDSSDKLNIFRNDLLRLNIDLLGPDVNFSKIDFSVETNEEGGLVVRTGLCSIKNIGKGIMGRIILEREKNGTYSDILDFANRMSDGLFGRSHFEYLSLSGCFDSICNNRKSVFVGANVLANCANISSLDKQSQQENLFSKNTELVKLWRLPTIKDWSEKEKLEKERLSLGFYCSGHPITKYKNILKVINIKNSNELDNINNLIFYGAGVVSQIFERFSSHGRFAKIQISDTEGMYEVTAYSEIFSIKNNLLSSGNILLFQLSVVKDSSGYKNIIAKDFWNLDDKLNDLINGYVIKINDTVDVEKMKILLTSNRYKDRDKGKKITFVVPLDEAREALVNTIENVDFNIEIIEQLRDLPGIVEVSPIISDNI